MTPPTYQGSTAACLTDFLSRYAKDESRQALATFAKVEIGSVARWQRGGSVPAGESLLRARVFLKLVGYEVDEFSQLPEVTQQFSELIAFDLITPQEARDTLGYSDLTGVFNVLLRGSGLLSEKQFRMERCVRENAAMLKEFVDDFKTRHETILPTAVDALLQKTLSTPATPVASSPYRGPKPPALPAKPATNNALSSPRHPNLIGASDERADSDTQVDDLQQQPLLGDEQLAQTLVHLLRATNGIVQSLDNSPEAKELRRSVRFAVGRESVLGLIEALERFDTD